jgi:hypothetical protein
MDKENIIETLIDSRLIIIAKLKDVIATNSFNYRTFGTSIEDDLFDIIISILKDKNLVTNNDQFRRAKDKNEFPDLTINTYPPIALEAKSGNRSKFDNGVWKTCKNSANDLGTFNSWDKKLSKFNGNDIFFVFIEYNLTDQIKEIIDLKIEPFYKFIGINAVGLLSYREKDGNLRPKDFDEDSPINSFDKFYGLLKKTDIYRSGRIIKKHKARIKSLS